MKSSAIKKLKILKPGETIGIFAPGSPVDPERFRIGVEQINKLGFKTLCPLDPSSRYPHTKGHFGSASVSERTRAFMSLLEDDSVSAIIAARGGYGSVQLLPALDFKAISRFNKSIVGYSDVTVLLANIVSRSGLVTIHGSTVASELARYTQDGDAKESVDALFKLLTSTSYRVSFPCEMIRDGQAEGVVLAGNLTLLQTLLGTSWDISFENCILMLEDIGEAPYRIHRALTQLKLSGKLARLAGVVFGRFSNCSAPNGPTLDETLRTSIDDIFEGTSYPVAIASTFGHDGLNLPLPLGCRARLCQGNFSTLESPLE